MISTFLPTRFANRLRRAFGLCLLLLATNTQAANLLFSDLSGNQVSSALPGDVVVGWTSPQTFVTDIAYFRIGVLDSAPAHTALEYDPSGVGVRFQIPFGTAAGPNTISFLNASLGTRHSGPLTINPSIPPIITSATAVEGTNGVEFAYIITAINNPTNITAAPLPAGLTFEQNGSIVSIEGTPTETGVHEIDLTAQGEHPTPGTATLTLTVHPKPVAITSALAVLGTNGMAFEYQIVTDNPATNYTGGNLSVLLPGLSLDAGTGLISGTPTKTGTFFLTIGAENGPWSDSEMLTIVLDPPAPEITSSLTAGGRKGAQFSYVIEASNNPTTFTASPLPEGLSREGPIIAGIPAAAGDYDVVITAANAGGVDTETLQLSFLPQAPVIDSAPTAGGTKGVAFSHFVTALNDPTGFTSGDRPAWLQLNGVTGELSGTPDAAGQFTVSVTATNLGGSSSQSLVVTIAPAVPIITSATTATATRGVEFQFQVTADNAPTGFTASGLPDGLSFNETTGLISGFATTLETRTVDLTASNETGAGMGGLTITVVDPAPVITSAGAASGTRDVDFSHQITADNLPTGFEVLGSLPPGVSLNTTSGLISGRPTAAGVYTVTVKAANSGGAGEAPLTITITDKPPVISSPATAMATSGSLFTYQIEASNNPTSYELGIGAPDWLSVDAQTGQLSGTPPAVPFTVNLQVPLIARNLGGQGAASLTVTLKPATPIITSATTAHGAAGSPFQYQIVASNLPQEFQISGFPPGYSVNMDTGLITGAPTAETTFQGLIFASNSGGTGLITLNVTIHRPVPEITSELTVTANAGIPFSYQITATQSPERYGGDTAPGLTLDTDTGILSGTPTTVGVHMIGISAGHQGGSGAATLTLTVNPPAITSSLDVTANVDVLFNHQITAEHMPDAFTAAGLPADLQINPATGVIEGLPKKPGIYEIPITASDGSLTAEATLRLTVWGGAGEPPVGVFPSAGAQLRILWPAAADGYILQATDSLAPPVMWTDVTSTPADSGSARELLIEATGSGDGRFYRLVKP